MKNVGLLFLGDLKHLMSNVISLIVVMGLVMVPPLYAWFTTLGFWDPYANTGNVKVAIANEDSGFESDLISTGINVGDQVVSQLHENDQFDWEFTNEEQAVDGVASGEYYAAIVLPDNFSADLMAVLSGDVRHSEIVYYSNEKESAIAPRVTSAGASGLQQQIDDSLTKTVADVVLGTTASLTNFMSGEGIASYATALANRLDTTVDEFDAASEQVTSFSTLVESTESLVRSTSGILARTGDTSSSTGPLLEEARLGIAQAGDAFSGSAALANSALDRVCASYDAVSAAADEAFDAASDDPEAAKALLANMQSSVDASIKNYQDAYDKIIAVSPDSSVLESLSAAIDSLNRLSVRLGDAQVALDDAVTNATQEQAAVRAAIADVAASLGTVQSSYGVQLQEQATQLSGSLKSVGGQASALVSQLRATSLSLSTTSGSLAGNLADVRGALDVTAETLATSSVELASTRDQLRLALGEGDLEKVRALIGDNAGGIATFFSVPTTLERHAVYPVEDNGSAMSPYYTSLSLWVGSIFLVALMSTKVSERRLKELDHPTPTQLYFGRYGSFCLLALVQATIVCLGNVLFLGVQCEHFWLYLLTGWLAALVFSNIVYTLTLSFGNVGKALAIVLLVMQIAGSGGTFPIEMSAPFFQAVYPWLPFTHAMAAFQDCIAGIYGNQYWISIIKLLAFLIPSLLLGLALRKPVIRLNENFNKKIEETKVL